MSHWIWQTTLDVNTSFLNLVFRHTCWTLWLVETFPILHLPNFPGKWSCCWKTLLKCTFNSISIIRDSKMATRCGLPRIIPIFLCLYWEINTGSPGMLTFPAFGFISIINWVLHETVLDLWFLIKYWKYKTCFTFTRKCKRWWHLMKREG